MDRQWDGYPLGLGLVVEDKPIEFSCSYIHDCIYRAQNIPDMTCL